MSSSFGNSTGWARSLHHLVKTVTMLSDRGIGLKVLTGQGAAIDTTTAAGRLTCLSYGHFSGVHCPKA